MARVVSGGGKYDDDESASELTSSNDAEDSEDSGQPNRGWLIPIGIAVGALGGLALLYAGIALGEGGPHYGGELKSGWNSKHVESTCFGMGPSEARRLDEEGEAVDSEDRPRRLDDSFATFDPTQLFEMKLLDGKSLMPYYGSADLEKDLPSEAEEAIFFFHGALRNAQDYFCSIKRIVQSALGNQTGKVIIISPKYHYQADLLNHNKSYNMSADSDTLGHEAELYWNGSKPWGDWRAGAAADEDSDPLYDSFEVVDDMVLILSNIDKFPKMRRIVLAGHSAGGQTVQRYAMVTHLRPQKLANDLTLSEMKSVRPGIDVRYVVANPSSYGYLDSMRWIYGWDATKTEWTEQIYAQYFPERGRKHWSRHEAGSRRRQVGMHNASEPYVPWGPWSPNYENFSAETPFICHDSRWNDWHYGLNWTSQDFGNLVPYLKLHPHLHRATEFYGARDVIYMVGENDTCSSDMLGMKAPEDPICLATCWTKGAELGCHRTKMDARCPAMLQGPNRNQRGRNYMKHLEHFFGRSVHRLFIVPGVGHEAEAIFQSNEGVNALFARQAQLLNSSKNAEIGL